MKPLILITNDDGYNAPGIIALAQAMIPLGEIVVVAPDAGQSAMSHAVTVKTPLRCTQVVNSQYPIYKVNGTPADCVKLAYYHILERKPDFIVSGINHGTNSSVSVIYSGTMGAAIEGAILNIPSVGFSLCSEKHDADFSIATKCAEQVMRKVMAHGLPDNTCLNVNVPEVSAAEFNGLKVCRQAKGIWKESFDQREDPRGATYFWLTGRFTHHETGRQDHDEWALENHYASIVPTKVDMTDYAALTELEQIFKLNTAH